MLQEGHWFVSFILLCVLPSLIKLIIIIINATEKLIENSMYKISFPSTSYKDQYKYLFKVLKAITIFIFQVTNDGPFSRLE